jgi:hypothetical protein
LPASIARQPRRRLLRAVCVTAILIVAIVISVVSFAFAVTTSFPDVPSGHPYYAAITELASRGIIGGYDNGNFGPGDNVRRQQFAKMIVLAGGYPVSEADVCPFTDVPAQIGTDPLYPSHYVAVCAAHEITTGVTATTFNPGGYITRYQVVSMVVRAANDLQAGLLATPPAGWTATGTWGSNATHGANAALAEYNHLLDGLDLAVLSPTGNMTRGEVAQVLYNLLGKLTPPTTTTTTTEVTTTTTSSTSTTTTSSTTTTTNPGWVGFEKLGGVFTESPAVCSWGSNRLDVFVRGTNTHLMHRWYNGVWSTWQDLGGVIAAGSSPAAVSWGPNRIDTFVRGQDNELWHMYWNGSAWVGFEKLGGVFTGSPTVCSWGTGRLDVFVRGTNTHLMHKWYNPDNGLWSTWQDLGGVIAAGSSPAAVSWGSNRIDVFVRGQDNELWQMSWNGSAWVGFTKLGGVFTESPAVCSWASGRLDVFVRGTNTHLMHRWYNGAWSAWQDLSGVLQTGSSPAAESWGSDHIDVFVRGQDNELWHMSWN